MTGKPNCRFYRNSSLEHKMEVQYKKLVFEPLKDQIKILGLYILNDNKYVYHVLNKMTETFYIINENNFQEMKIKKQVNHMTQEDVIKYTCSIGDCRTIHFQILHDDEVPQLSEMKIHTHNAIYNKLDDYLYDMFHDIYRMSVSK